MRDEDIDCYGTVLIFKFLDDRSCYVSMLPETNSAGESSMTADHSKARLR
jgi:hypothetical protein